MYTPLFYCVENQNVHFIYQCLSTGYAIASGSNIGGLIDFVRMCPQSKFVATKSELTNRLNELNIPFNQMVLEEEAIAYGSKD